MINDIEPQVRIKMTKYVIEEKPISLTVIGKNRREKRKEWRESGMVDTWEKYKFEHGEFGIYFKDLT